MSKKTLTVILAVLSALYIAGIIALFFSVGVGLVLWGAALLGSLIFYFYQLHQKQLETERELEAAEAKAEKTEE